jgi:hypothetical protein
MSHVGGVVYIVLDALEECSERHGLLRLITTMLDAKLPAPSAQQRNVSQSPCISSTAY